MSSSQINTLPDSSLIKSRAFIPAKLPDDFLRVKLDPTQLPASYHHHRQLRQQSSLPLQLNQFKRVNYRGKLLIKFIEARLTKNYGLTKMDCYIKFNLNGKVFETDTDYSCGKNPKWNKTIMCYLPEGVDSFVLEIYDENSLTQDEQIAVLHYVFPEELFQGVPINEWFPLSGRLGEQKEGNIHLDLQFQEIDNSQPPYPTLQQATMAETRQTQQFKIKDEDVKNLKEMFPTFDEDLIRSLLETNVGDQEKTINMLLSMSS